MGHTVETLRGMYERCTPEEKRRPIEEAIDELLFFQLPSTEPKQEVRSEWETLLQQLQQLSPAERQQLMAALEK
jgi:FKBP-type peptidyl-prolyl cis-trans isomerase (trigger factor)